MLIDTSVMAKTEAAFTTGEAKKRWKRKNEATKASKTKKQAVKRFGEKTALRVKMIFMTTQTVILGEILKRNLNLVLIWFAVGITL